MVNQSPRTYAPRVPQAEAERRLIDAAIALLREGDFSRVSSRRIAEQAQLQAPSIARYFGSMHGLFAAVAYELAQRSLTAMPETGADLVANPDLVLRSRLVAWCLANGADPADFMTSRESPGGRSLLERQRQFAEVSPRATAALTELIRFAFEGFAVLGSTHTFSSDQLADVLALTQSLRRALPELERQLGWDQAD
jgi:AcrR family transcriptional regulator